jgi:ribosome maturation factor RimP
MGKNVSYLWELFEPVVVGMGYELVEIEYHPNPKHGVLRLYIDRESGIQLDDCTEVSRQVSALIDVEDPISGHFNLEVSSPGLDRPLRKMEDFLRFKGEVAKINMSMPIDGQKNFKGRLSGVEDDLLILECEDKVVRLPITAIHKARLVPNI